MTVSARGGCRFEAWARTAPVAAGRRRGAHPIDRLAADALELGTALEELERLSPRQAEVIECRFFAGLSVEDTAMALGVSTR